jgi:hypothetical protein
MRDASLCGILARLSPRAMAMAALIERALVAAGKNYLHRKQWVIERSEQLCSIFAIEVCAYAVMSNYITWCCMSITSELNVGRSRKSSTVACRYSEHQRS